MLLFHSSVHTRPSGMSLVALPAKGAAVNRSNVSLQGRCRVKNPAWSTPIIFHLSQERQRGFPRAEQAKDQDKWVWGSIRG